MKKLHEQADILAKDMRIIADNLGKYNPGLQTKRISLEAIQYDIASLGRELAGLYAGIGGKIKNEINPNSPVDQSRRE